MDTHEQNGCNALLLRYGTTSLAGCMIKNSLKGSSLSIQGMKIWECPSPQLLTIVYWAYLTPLDGLVADLIYSNTTVILIEQAQVTYSMLVYKIFKHKLSLLMKVGIIFHYLIMICYHQFSPTTLVSVFLFHRSLFIF